MLYYPQYRLPRKERGTGSRTLGTQMTGAGEQQGQAAAAPLRAQRRFARIAR
jgi:hypothetical protein